jgi:DNA-binding transcriptional MerR regulator
MAEELLTISEMADRLRIPPSTAAYYIKKFRSFIPSKGRGRNKRYFIEAVEILEIISGHYKNNLTAADIEQRLKSLYPEEIDIDTTTTTATTTKQQQSEHSLELYQQDIEARQELAAAIRELSEILKDMKRPKKSWFNVLKKGKH